MFTGSSSQRWAHRGIGQSVLMGGGCFSLKYKAKIPSAVKGQQCCCIFTLQQD